MFIEFAIFLVYGKPCSFVRRKEREDGMKNLVIVESPAKSKTIGKYLGPDYTVVSSKGHIRDLAIKGKEGLGVDIEDHFRPTYEISKDKTDIVADLRKEAKKADYVYLATDPDREGEAISWHLSQVLDLPEDAEDRVTFHEITKNAVRDAFQQPRAIDMNLVHSQETRRILDRIIGFKLSKLLKTKIKSKSAGRVQSVALKLIVEREREIQAFKPQEYWTIDAVFTKDGKDFKASLARVDGKKAEIHSQQEAEAVYNRCNGLFNVTAIKAGTRSRSQPLPFITSTLQQEASQKLGFAAKRTMSIAQRLYEGIDVGNGQEGLITYMRTDSTRLSNVYIQAARGVIEQEYGKQYLGYYHAKNDANAQDAHEAIRPTSVANTPEKLKPYLSQEQYKLYKMIYSRAMASLMAKAEFDTMALTLSRDGCDFTASGSRLKFDGFLKVYGAYDTRKEDEILPALSEGEEMLPKDLKSNQHFTEPPARYTEAKLIKAMEEEGIGRPSTYAMIIDTIQARGYVTLERASEKTRTRVFRPTDQGVLTCEKLDEFFSGIINVKYTAQMESELDEIAEGRSQEEETLQAFWNKFNPLLQKAYEGMEKIQPEKVGEKCPVCGGELVYRTSRYGKFISCENFPKCSYKRAINADKEKPEPIGRQCPDCGGELVKRKNRYGSYFIGCANYPKCHYMENLEGQRIYAKADRQAAKKTEKKTAVKKTAAKKTTAKKTAAKKTTAARKSRTVKKEDAE
jgi:DNA topoisomerase-1